MSKDFFVMLQTQDGGYTPMMDDEDIAKYETEEEARKDARNNPLGEHFGAEIFERGYGTFI